MLAYGYSADGRKREKRFNNTVTRQYRGAMVYDGSGTPEYMLHPEGMTVHTGNGQWEWRYHLTDHLGNTRAVLDENGAILQQTDYHPFGAAYTLDNTDKNKYLYGGKELQDEVLGGIPLNMYDFGARFYDPMGRFTSPDPLAEKYYNISPYAYCLNNPINLVDLDGKEPSLWDTIVNYLSSFFSQAEPGHNEDVYERAYVENDKEAQKEIQQAETVETILNTEITPYASVSIGKETGGVTSFWYGITITPSKVYLSGGVDMSFGTPGIGMGGSASASLGIFIGPESGIEGAGYGVGGGSFIGVSGSRSIGKDKTYGIGVTATNTPAWVSANLGYTLPIMRFNKQNK